LTHAITTPTANGNFFAICTRPSPEGGAFAFAAALATPAAVEVEVLVPVAAGKTEVDL